MGSIDLATQFLLSRSRPPLLPRSSWLTIEHPSWTAVLHCTSVADPFCPRCRVYSNPPKPILLNTCMAISSTSWLRASQPAVSPSPTPHAAWPATSCLIAGCLCVNALFLARQTLMETVGSGREAAAVWCTSPRTARRCFAMRMDPRAPTVATRPAAAPMVRGGEPA